MSKSRIADIYKIDESISDLRREIRKGSAQATGLAAKIRSTDSRRQKLAGLRGRLTSLKKLLAADEARLKSLLAKRQHFVSRATNEIQGEGKTARQKRWIAVQRETTSELKTQVQLIQQMTKTPAAFGTVPKERQLRHDYDVFISHATEDKEDFVRPLATKLINTGLRVWYDELSLSVGDSLRKSIDAGLAKSQYGLVVLSSAFFAKNWTQYELNGLVSKEMEGTKVILPIWHKVTKDEVMSFSPSLVDKVALSSAFLSVDEIAAKLFAAIKQKK